MAASTVLEVVASPILGVVVNNLRSLTKEIGLIWGVEKQMKKLSSKLSTIEAVLEDAEEKQQTNKAIVNWLQKLKEAAYDADDILDAWTTEAMELEMGTEAKQVSGSFLTRFSYKELRFRRKIAKKIEEITETFDAIASERSSFHLAEGAAERKNEVDLNRDTSSMITKSQIYGRDEDTKYIVEHLLDNVNKQVDLSIFPILGIGGLGKTTVAQLVYNDERVKEHFEIRLWVCVAENFDVKRLTKALLVSVSRDACLVDDLDPLQCCLEEKLAGKRFLLVLDDVWNENQEEWNKYMYSLRCGAKGSSVILTTRLKTVASITGTCRPYQLKFLSEDDCWSLFRQRAFGMGNEESPELAKIGKEMVKKCGGLPLAAKVLGGLMRFKTEETEWLLVRDSKIWNLPQTKDNTILPALRLSYTHLSPHLRQCFAYCSIFRKGHKMVREEVIQLWIANSLVRSQEGIQLEDTGNEIFNALLWRSFFQVEANHGTISYLMHDHLHDLACSITMNESCNVDDCGQITNLPRGTRHLSASFQKHTPSSSVDHFQSILKHSAPHLRTLTLFGQRGTEFSAKLSMSTFKSLRVMSLESVGVRRLHSIGTLRHLRYLKISGTKINALSDSFGNLKNLRYLEFSNNSRLVSIPNSICILRNMQTLKVMECPLLEMLPEYMKNMTSLRHLHIKGCCKLTKMPTELGKLSYLQTLTLFIVGPDNGRRLKELRGLSQLRGKLIIQELDHVTSSEDAKEAHLTEKQNLRSLGLFWSASHQEETNDRDVIEALRPHPNLLKLSVKRYKGLTFPSWLDVSYLPNLVQVSLRECQRCEQLPSLGALRMLTTLKITSMLSIKFFSGADGFPMLRWLDLVDMPELEEWSSTPLSRDVLLLPSLTELVIRKCPKLKRIPLSPGLKKLKIEDSNEMVLRTFENLPCLSSLEISFRSLICFPEGMLQNLTALTSLTISFCNKLETLPTQLGSLTKLTTLVVASCPKLVSLPQSSRNLLVLKDLMLHSCKNLEFLPEVGQSSLKRLKVSGCRSLTGISDALRYQTTLQALAISACPKLEASQTLEFQHLTSLQYLSVSRFYNMTSIQNVSSMLQTLMIEECFYLTSLPEWVGNLTMLKTLDIRYCKSLTNLPHRLQHLTNLQTLVIWNCHPELHRRCREGGEEWHKISHIPYIKISMVLGQ